MIVMMDMILEQVVSVVATVMFYSTKTIKEMLMMKEKIILMKIMTV